MAPMTVQEKTSKNERPKTRRWIRRDEWLSQSPHSKAWMDPPSACRIN